MKYNFTKVDLVDLEGKKHPGQEGFHKELANLVYSSAKDLSLVETARTIFAGKEVELDKVEIAEIKKLIEESPLLAFAKKALIDYIESVKPE
ncbi:MAG: hypothetical protein GY861_18500 [bacterium]|nr:hypothetical protein [bacterium]